MNGSLSIALDQSESCDDPMQQEDRSARSWFDLLLGQFLSKGALSVFDQAVVSGTSFVTNVMIGRACSESEFGVYYLAMSILLFVRGLQEQLVSAPYMIYCHRREGASLAAYSGSVFVYQAILSGLTAVGLAGVIGVLWTGNDRSNLVVAVGALLVAAPLLLLREFVRRFSFAHLQLATALAIDVAVAVLQLGGLLLLWRWQLFSIPAVYAVMGAACSVACFVWFLTKKQPVRVERLRLWADWCHNWSFAKWALACYLLGCTTPYIMPWVVAVVHDEAETGALGACATLAGVAYMFVSGMSNFLTPKAARAFAQGGVAELASVLQKFVVLFAAVLGTCCLVTIVGGDWLLAVVYGSKYQGEGWIVAILCLSVLVDSLGVTAGNGLWAMELPSANLVADFCALSAVVVATLSLVPPWGVTGAALATLSGTTAGAAVRCAVLGRLMASLRQSPGIGSE